MTLELVHSQVSYHDVLGVIIFFSVALLQCCNNSQGGLKQVFEMPNAKAAWVVTAVCVFQEHRFGMSAPSSIMAFR